MSLVWEHPFPRDIYQMLLIYSELYPVGRSHG